MLFIHNMIKLGYTLDYALSLDFYERSIYWGVMLSDQT